MDTTMEQNRPNVGGKIRRIRREKDISQKVLAEKIGMTQAAISRIEQGEVDVNSSVIFRIAEALNVSPASLFEPDEAQKTAAA